MTDGFDITDKLLNRRLLLSFHYAAVGLGRGGFHLGFLLAAPAAKYREVYVALGIGLEVRQ